MKEIKTQVVAIHIPIQFMKLTTDEIRQALFNGYLLKKGNLKKYVGYSTRENIRVDKDFWKMLKYHAKKERITLRELTENILFTQLDGEFYE